MRNFCCLLISAALAAPPAYAKPPARIEIAYEVMRNGAVVADVFHHMEHDGRVYQLSEVWKGRGLYALRGTVKRTSRGIVSEEGLQPLEFMDERTGRRTAWAKFDWHAKTLTMQYKSEPRIKPLPVHAHDRLAFIFDFAFAPPRARDVSFDLADGRGLSHHVYSVGARERLKIPAGEFDALKLLRATGEERAEIWLAADRSYLPVRVLVTNDDGTRYDQVATRIATP